jgi:hypothetical protein
MNNKPAIRQCPMLELFPFHCALSWSLVFIRSLYTTRPPNKFLFLKYLYTSIHPKIEARRVGNPLLRIKKYHWNYYVQYSMNIWRPTWRSGGNTRLLRKRSRVRFPHGANICVHEHVSLYWVWVFLCIICMYLRKKMYKYVLIRYLESITQAL